jgi:uncharacterized protein (UPF0276 family)
VRQLSEDRVGLGWRGPLAASIYAYWDEVDVIELIADDYFRASRRDLRSLRSLARDIPTVCHGVTLGLASVLPVDDRRIHDLARVIEAIEPVMWSEHLAFVRAGGYEIGHLAAPPRNPRTVEGAIRNLERIRMIVGAAPALENIATLIAPPDSSMTETEWISAIADPTGCALLLDLHNLYANCVNFDLDPDRTLRELDAGRVRIVHLSGGSLMEHTLANGTFPATRLLDDHCHDVPDIVFEMLTDLAERCSEPLTVIIERDGCYPEFSVLIRQMRRAREALACGRRRREMRQTHAQVRKEPSGVCEDRADIRQDPGDICRSRGGVREGTGELAAADVT